MMTLNGHYPFCVTSSPFCRIIQVLSICSLKMHFSLSGSVKDNVFLAFRNAVRQKLLLRAFWESLFYMAKQTTSLSGQFKLKIIDFSKEQQNLASILCLFHLLGLCLMQFGNLSDLLCLYLLSILVVRKESFLCPKPIECKQASR